MGPTESPAGRPDNQEGRQKQLLRQAVKALIKTIEARIIALKQELQRRTV